MIDREGGRNAVTYGHDRLVVRYTGEVSSDSVFRLADIIDLGMEYYGYRRIDLHIDSAGGSGPALLYLVDRLSAWSEVPGFTLHTRGLTMVASAAAVLLSLGTVGRRTVGLSTVLLWHNARVIITAPVAWTRRELLREATTLTAVDRRVTHLLARHVLSGTGGRAVVRPWLGGAEPLPEIVVETVDELSAIYARVADLDVVIPPEAAVGLRLVDTVEGL